MSKRRATSNCGIGGPPPFTPWNLSPRDLSGNRRQKQAHMSLNYLKGRFLSRGASRDQAIGQQIGEEWRDKEQQYLLRWWLCDHPSLPGVGQQRLQRGAPLPNQRGAEVARDLRKARRLGDQCAQ